MPTATHAPCRVLDFPSPDQRRDRVLDAALGVANSRREHELRNLLYLVISFTQLLEQGQAGAVSEQQKEFLRHVIECAEKIRGLLQPASPAQGAAHAR